MSDSPPAEDKEKDKKAAAPSSGKTPKIVLALLALNLGASGFATFKLVTAAEAAPAHEKEKELPPGPINKIEGPVVPLDPFVVNLDEPGTSRYLKVTIQLELHDHESEEHLEHSKQLVRDSILSYLSGLTVKDTLGSEAKEKIRKDVIASMDKLLGEGRVRRIFLQEFVVQ